MVSGVLAGQGCTIMIRYRVKSELLTNLPVLAAVALLALRVACRELSLEERAAKGRAAMTADLLRLARAESLYYAAHGTFTGSLDALRERGRPFRASDEVRLYITRADTGGWRGVASSVWTEDVCRLSRSASSPRRAAEQTGPECGR